VPFRHLLYEFATFSFRGNPKEIYLVSKIFLILTKVLHTDVHTVLVARQLEFTKAGKLRFRALRSLAPVHDQLFRFTL
jgi:hypothetical protein